MYEFNKLIKKVEKLTVLFGKILKFLFIFQPFF